MLIIVKYKLQIYSRKQAVFQGDFSCSGFWEDRSGLSPKSMYSAVLTTRNSCTCATGATLRDYNPVYDTVVSLFYTLGGRYIISFL